MKNKELYTIMVNAIEKITKTAGTLTRWEAVNFFIGFFKIIDEEKLTLIQKLYADGFIKK